MAYVNNFANNGRAYISGMRPILNKRALFSDTTETFIHPLQPTAYGLVTIKFRTARNNVDRVDLVSTRDIYPMEKIERDEQFDYYAAKMKTFFIISMFIQERSVFTTMSAA